jgi:hypothetical protein
MTILSACSMRPCIETETLTLPCYDLLQSTYTNVGHSTKVGAVLTGAVYVAGNGSIVWHGFGFSATGPYNCAFALGPKGDKANGYYTYINQKNGSSPAGETGAWLLEYKREPTLGECTLVYRDYTAKDLALGCTESSG